MTLLALLSLAATAGRTAAQNPPARFRWEELQKQGKVASGTTVEQDRGGADYRLKITNSESHPMTITVLTVDRPAVKGPRYALTGQIRYENVEGAGYLELWNYFPNGGQFFSRTLADQGPMMKLTGASEWRPFLLPFDATGAPPPTRLVLNVVLPGRGVVYLGPLELADQRGSAGMVDGPATNRLLSFAGTIVGGVGALIGVLTSLGRARRFVIASAMTLVALGVFEFAAGAAGFFSTSMRSAGSPMLILFGFLTSLVPLGLLPTIRKRYEEAELRAMRAHDLA